MPDSPKDNSYDLTGVGKAMSAIPDASWERLVTTACDTFEKVVAPITEITGGIGRLVKSKFDGLVDVQKVLAAEAVLSAQEKVTKSGLDAKRPRPDILIQVIENAADSADTGIRELWSNLLAQEMTGGNAHPEVGRVLSRLTSDDAAILSEVANNNPTSISKAFAEQIRRTIASSAFGLLSGAQMDPKTFNHGHMENLGLIVRADGFWEITIFGRGFIEAISEPKTPAPSETE